jgi:hypothetical protein
MQNRAVSRFRKGQTVSHRTKSSIDSQQLTPIQKNIFKQPPLFFSQN